MSVSNNGTVETDISQSDPEDDIPHPSTKKVLDPDDPRMAVFQNSLKQMLLKQKDDIQTELLNMEKKIKNKKMIHESVEQERNIITDRLRAQHDALKKFRSTEKDLQTMKRKTENSINEVKQQFNEITKKTSKEMKKISVLKRKLGYSQNLLKDLTIYEEEQAINFKKFDSKKSQAKQLKKMHLNNQQKKDLLSSSLTQEVERLEDRMKQLIKESEAKYNESELLKQKVIDSSTNLDTINRDNVKLTLLWDTVLSRINQRHESIQRMKIESQEANEKYRTLLREVDSYKRSLEKESLRKDDLCKSANQLEQKKMNLQSSYDTVLIEFNNSKDEYSQLIQITEFEHLNLNQVLMDQKTLDNEIQMLINLLAIKSNLKLKYEEDVLSEFKVLSNTSKNNSNHLKTIDELTIKNTEHERTLADFEETFKQYKLELEQKRATSTNLKNDILKSTQCLNEQELVISTLHFELKKLDIQWRDANDSILYKNTTLKSENNNEKKNLMLVIDQVQHKIDDAQKETEFIKQSWVKNQNQNVQLIIKRNKQVNELNTVHENALILDSKNKNLKMEIISLSKQLDQHERTINNMKRKINTLNENVYKKEGKNSQLLNETEWFQNASIAEMKENEKQCLEKILQLKLVKNELNELKIASTKKQCEFSSLDSKVQAIVKLKKIMKSKDGDNADIEIKKQYIHKMQRREDQLNKTVKQLMTALENTLKTHANIYEKAKSKPVNSKRINDEKKTFLKKLDNLRTVIKKKEIECRNLDKSLNCSQHDKIELETEITSLNDKITHIQKEINDLTANIEDSGVTKIKNGYKHTNLHSYVKSLEEVNNDKHSLLVKDETKTNDELAAQLKITSDLTSVVEALKNDFPDLDNEIKRILCFFKSAMEIHLENNE